MDCSECGAPLPPKSNICTYCGALNDTDLRAAYRNVKKGPESDLPCPQCDIRLQTIDLGFGGGFYIERCERCLGLFFDPGELRVLIDNAVSNVHEVDHQRMAVLIEEEGVTDHRSVQYVKCPICRQLMNRKSYGARAGIVADTCKGHGVWLNGGELGQLLKWAKAGGRLHDQARQAEEERRQHRSQEARSTAASHSDVFTPAQLYGGESGIPVLRCLLGLLLHVLR